MDFRFYEIWRTDEYLYRLFDGVLLSVELTAGGGALGFLLALLLASMRRSATRWVALLAACYIEFIRNTPLIVQLFFVTFGLPLLFSYRWPFAASALLALTLNFSAYFAEIVRAGLDSVGKGQLEAARSLGLPPRRTMFSIVLPQALAGVYPSLVSQFIFLFLTTGIISEIGVEELTWSGRFIADRTFRDFEVFILLTILYVLLALLFRLALSAIGRVAFRWQRAR